MRSSFAVRLFLVLCVRVFPAASPNSTSLQEREIVDSVSCLRLIPSSDPQSRRLYKEKLAAAFYDARKMAAQALDDGFPKSTAYSHYFRPQDYPQVHRMFRVIVDTINDTPEDPINRYAVQVTCGDDQNAECPVMRVFAVADEWPGGKISFCDIFFSTRTDETRMDLGHRGFDASGWCRPYETFDFFEVAGVTVLHEMTHLSDLAVRAGLPRSQFSGSCPNFGTEDVQSLGDDQDKREYVELNAWESARQLKDLWDDHELDPDFDLEPIIPPTQNAESYAAAALEYYFLVKCNMVEIRGI